MITIARARNIVSRNNISRYECCQFRPTQEERPCQPDSTPSIAKSSKSCRRTAASPTWSSPAASVFPRRPVSRRVRALEEAGYIKGYRALLDEKKLGYEVTVFAMVHLASQAEADLVAFEEFVRAQPLVRECWMLSGEIDFVLKCVAPRPENLPGLRRKTDRRAQCAQREDVADAAQFKGCGHGADGRVSLSLLAWVSFYTTIRAR